MKGKLLTLISLVLIFFNVGLGTILAASTESEGNNAKVLIIYPSSIRSNIEKLDELRVLDTLVGHFSNDIEVVPSDFRINSNINDYTNVIYYGLVKEDLDKQIVEYLENFKGKLIGIGYNVEQIKKRFSFINFGQNMNITEVVLKGKTYKLEITEYIRSINDVDNKYILANGKYNDKLRPLFVVNDKNNTFYFGATNIYSGLHYYLGECLFKYFNDVNIESSNVAYLRLEDVNPTRDPDNLMEIAKYLKEKDIPYMVVLIPTYREPKTGKILHVKDYPKLLKTIKYMQNNGAGIILHGYTHQYRDTETGEGFEFWDSINDAPINPDNGVSEDEYIRARIENGIEELVTHGIYPLAFEAPHYAISQNGYKIVSEYFSTYVGNIQINDDTYENSFSPAYISTPSFLNGLSVIPENIGFVENEDINAIKSMVKKAEFYSGLSDSIIGGFYHPYLGLDKLKMLVEELETIEDIKWFDLKEQANTVKTSNISIKSKDGIIDVDKPLIFSKYQVEYVAIFFYVGIVVIGFLIFILRNRKNE
ncbi:polysaccharide deacetylase family protein [Clostridium peptidivorans]|uniref:polysaccharide deacetylase family protein n=1 Tax=Clostridium peptidivorans TaxID=100174 RepID=UPI0015CC7D73|nr:polysaccharide deacetylase family protein [Clostridium peptidivorans]